MPFFSLSTVGVSRCGVDFFFKNGNYLNGYSLFISVFISSFYVSKVCKTYPL